MNWDTAGSIGLIIAGAWVFWILFDILWEVNRWINAWAHDREDLHKRRRLRHEAWLRRYASNPSALADPDKE